MENVNFKKNLINLSKLRVYPNKLPTETEATSYYFKIPFYLHFEP